MIQVSQEEMSIIQDIIKKNISNCEVRAFGSRYKKTARTYSDLDLAVIGKEKLSLRNFYDLKEAFEESDLIFRVDILDWNSTSENFKSIINNGYEVIYTPPKLT
jgi:type I restriction enzyme S subunit